MWLSALLTIAALAGTSCSNFRNGRFKSLHYSRSLGTSSSKWSLSYILRLLTILHHPTGKCMTLMFQVYGHLLLEMVAAISFKSFFSSDETSVVLQQREILACRNSSSKKCNGGKNRVGPNTWAEVVPSLLSVVPKEVDKDDVLHNINS